MTAPFASVPAFKESRLASLYSDFSHLKQLNPEGYAANVRAWLDLLVQCLKQHTFDSTLLLPRAQLAPALSLDVLGPPKSLSVVLQSMIDAGELVPFSVFRDGPGALQALFSDYFSPARLFSRTYSALRLSLYSLESHTSDPLVHLPTMVSCGEGILHQIQREVEAEASTTACLLDNAMLDEMLLRASPHLSDVDKAVLTLYFSRDLKKLYTRKDPHDPSRTFVKVGGPASLTAEEIGIINLKASIRSVQRNVLSLENTLDREIPERIKYLLEKKDDRLKNVLLRRREVTKSMNRAVAILENLTQVLDKVKDAKSNAAVYSSLQSAKSLLLNLNQQVSFSDIDKLVEDLDEQVALTDETTAALSLQSLGVDEAEIELEYEKLQQEYKESERVGSDEQKEHRKTEASQNDNNDEDKAADELAQKLEAVNLEDVAPIEIATGDKNASQVVDEQEENRVLAE